MQLFNILLVILVLIYGLSFGVKNFILRITTFVWQERYLQSSFGKILDWAWFVSLIYVCFVLIFGTETVIAFLFGMV